QDPGGISGADLSAIRTFRKSYRRQRQRRYRRQTDDRYPVPDANVPPKADSLVKYYTSRLANPLRGVSVHQARKTQT
ncbi:MAG: hypothetical protein Q8R28_09170, partial [Dehalococcoidia bacterium]|nr:hypothetical protein [Dehalococcoidia bacterium]